MDASNERLAEGREELRGQRGLFRSTIGKLTLRIVSPCQVVIHFVEPGLNKPPDQLQMRFSVVLAQRLPQAVAGTVQIQRPGHFVAVWRPGDLLPRCSLHLAGVLHVLVTTQTSFAVCSALDSMDFALDGSWPTCHGFAFTAFSNVRRSGLSTLRPSAKSWRPWRALPGMPPGLQPTGLGSSPAPSWLCTGTSPLDGSRKCRCTMRNHLYVCSNAWRLTSGSRYTSWRLQRPW